MSMPRFRGFPHIEAPPKLCEPEDNQDLAGPLLATQQLLRGCQCMVERYVASTLPADSWRQLLNDNEGADLTVRYIHGQADPSTQKVIERLLRFTKSERNKEITVAETRL